MLKVFGLDVPAKLEAAKASLELRFERTADQFMQVGPSSLPRWRSA
jgi:hypothetical protein